jgi:hypothetical protein
MDNLQCGQESDNPNFLSTICSTFSPTAILNHNYNFINLSWKTNYCLIGLARQVFAGSGIKVNNCKIIWHLSSAVIKNKTKISMILLQLTSYSHNVQL